MKLTKVIAFLLAVMMLLSAVSCGKNNNNPAGTTAASANEGTNAVTGDDKPAIPPETPVTGAEIDNLLSKGIPLNTKINNLRDKGYVYGEEQEAGRIFDLDYTSGFKAGLAEGNTLIFKLSLQIAVSS